MKETKLSHKDLVKLGIHEAKQGRSLSQIEADFKDKGIERKDTLNALKEVEYYNKIEEASKARKEAEAKKLHEAESVSEVKASPESEKKSSFGIVFLVILVLIGLAVFYYFYNNRV